MHAWDVTAALGLPSMLTPGLAANLLPAARAIVEPLRQFGVYAPALVPRAGDDTVAELLRYLGRDPNWRPLSPTQVDNGDLPGQISQARLASRGSGRPGGGWLMR
ncbi:MAG: hypothetical protein ACR2MP_01630 [Streptosporangiaceae bacterium]